jgi:CS domain
MDVDHDEKITAEQCEALDKENKAKELLEQAGMHIVFCELFYLIRFLLALPYEWTQELGELDMTVPVPQGTRGADLAVVLQKKKLSIGLKGLDPIVDGELCKEIKVEDSTWTVRKYMPFSFFKF